MVDLRGRDFLKLLDYSPEEIKYLIRRAETLKKQKHNNESHRYLKGKQIAMIFEKDSTRTRCAFEAGAHDLGMEATYLGPTGSQMGKKETIEDTARVLSRMFDGIEYRGFGQDVVEELAKYSDVPVWNGLTNEFHPTQMLADMMTCAKLGMHFVACAPREVWPDENLVLECRRICEETGGSIDMDEDIMKATKDADVLYTDVWVSMGEAQELWEKRINLLKPYQINMDVVKNAKPDVIFLHCLPSFHNTGTTIGKEIYEKFGLKEMEVTDEVFESSHSKVFDEAENRLHTIKAVMLETLKDE